MQTVKTRSQVRDEPGHSPGPVPRSESLAGLVVQESLVAVPSAALQLPPGLLGRPDSVRAGQYVGDPKQHTAGLPEDRNYREVSVSSTGVVHGQGTFDGERSDDELPWVDAVAPVWSEELGLPVD